jgi:hypothetical protein
MFRKYMLTFLVVPLLLNGGEPPDKTRTVFSKSSANPIWDRARGYLSQGKFQSAISNYGDFINWDHSPAGLWGNFQYIPALSLVSGVPGQFPSKKFNWTVYTSDIYEMTEADYVRHIAQIVFNKQGQSITGKRKESLNALTDEMDWYYDEGTGILYLNFPDGNPADFNIELRMHWAMRPPFDSPESDTLVYWGATVSESWFDRTTNTARTDWDASIGAKGRTHSGEVTAGDVYAVIYTNDMDTYPLLATSTIPDTWPLEIDEEGNETRKWPGWWAEKMIIENGDTSWVQVEGRFISDTDIYMEFDDRWATRDIDPEQGYPMGLKVYATAHSYGRSYAEDIAFITMKVVNESNKIKIYREDGSWYYLNDGKGYDYKGAYIGFYFDVDSYSALANGSFSGRTNDDDMMGYNLDYNFAYIYDLNDESGGYTDLAYTAIKLLDSPEATEPVDLDADGNPDILPGEKLGLTDWHWFNWYNRPGVAKQETNSGPFAGDGETPVASNKEEIQFKLMAGDTTNLSANESKWFFHPDPNGNINPHFDSMEGLLQDFPEGLDCVFIMSSGPFDLAVGDTINFSFAVLMGEDENDLIRNAGIAQIMYDLHYQGFSPPQAPTATVVPGDQKVSLFWDDAAEYSKDIVTGYSDFEGYKIYKSTDGGITWGDPLTDKIYDNNGVHVGWKPIAQFDYTEEEDIEKYGKEISGPDPLAPWFNLGSNTGLKHSFIDTDVENGVEYSYAIVAYDIGIEPSFTIDWNKDSVLTADSEWVYIYNPDTIWSENNPDGWMEEIGLASLENPKGSSVLDPQFVKVIPNAHPSNISGEIKFVANPSNFGNGIFGFQVINLEELKGHDYRVIFVADPSDKNYPDLSPKYENPRYTIINVTTGDTLIKESGRMNYFAGNTDIFSDIFDGMRIKLSNYHPTNSKLAEVGFEESIKWFPKPLVTEGRFGMDTTIVKFITQHPEKSLYDYIIKFGSMGIDTSVSWGPFRKVDLPFQIFNKHTGKKAKVYTMDLGADDKGNTNDVGERDGKWTAGEFILIEEVGVDYSDSLEKIKTYTIDFLNINGPENIQWEDFDSIIVYIKKPFFDGDFWKFSTADLVQPKEVTDEMLDQIRVVPNPYIVSAYWEQNQYRKKIQFTHLPKEAIIKIYTLTGEYVQTIYHNDPFSGAEEWDLVTYNRQEIAPGLYIYTVETPDKKKHVGKFAVIR